MGDKFVKSKVIQNPVSQGIGSVFKWVGNLGKKIVDKSKVLSAFFNTPSKPECKLVADMLHGTKEQVANEFTSFVSKYLKAGKGTATVADLGMTELEWANILKNPAAHLDRIKDICSKLGNSKTVKVNKKEAEENAIKLLEKVDFRNDYFIDLPDISFLSFHWALTDKTGNKAVIEYVIKKISERTGKYIKPAMGITFADGKAKVEAESFTDSSVAVTPEVEDEATVLKEVGGWPAFSAEYRINFTEAKRVKLVLRYKWVSAQWGNYGAAELYLDNGAKIPNVSGNDNSNIGEAEEGPTSEWMTAESSVFDIAACIHTIKLQTPGGCKVSWDYFELVEVAAE